MLDMISRQLPSSTLIYVGTYMSFDESAFPELKVYGGRTCFVRSEGLRGAARNHGAGSDRHYTPKELLEGCVRGGA